MSAISVGFAGMTHLGINSAAATAARGFDVVGYDADHALVERLRQHRLPVFEEGLAELIMANTARLRFSSEARELRGCDIVYVSVDVPTDGQGASDLGPVRRLIETVAANLQDSGVLVVLCQVPPGFTRQIRGRPHDRVIYQVETLVFGSAVERALKPERFIVGCADPARPLPAHYREVLDSFGCPILIMRYESAELAKISINFCLAASIGVANTLAEVSEAVGADWQEIVPALKLDRRIGSYSYLDPGLGLAGGNLERDLRTVLDIAAAGNGQSGLDVDAGIVKAWVNNSQHRKDWCWRVLDRRLLADNPMARIAVLGLAYKANTASTKNAASLALLDRLRGKDVRVHDPVVPASAATCVTRCAGALDCASGADALVVTTPWPQYRELAVEDISRVMRGRLIVDPYRILDGRRAADAGFEYHALGMRPLSPA
jgi:UDPglucose 6-dehydrogenase